MLTNCFLDPIFFGAYTLKKLSKKVFMGGKYTKSLQIRKYLYPSPYLMDCFSGSGGMIIKMSPTDMHTII